jgi:hypothetical protein
MEVIQLNAPLRFVQSLRELSAGTPRLAVTTGRKWLDIAVAELSEHQAVARVK